MKALQTPGFSAKVQFGVPRVYSDRRTAADATWAEFTAMRDAERCREEQEELQTA